MYRLGQDEASCYGMELTHLFLALLLVEDPKLTDGACGEREVAPKPTISKQLPGLSYSHIPPVPPRVLPPEPLSLIHPAATTHTAWV